MPKTLIVPVDGSKPADHAFRCAQRLAAHLDPCDIVVMTASTYPDDRRRAHLDALVRDATETRIRAELVAGEPAEAIVRLTAECAGPVVCMATRGRGRVSAPILGSVATEVVRRVEAPVLLVGPGCEKDWWHYPAKLVACWADEDSNEILAPAQEWSDALGMELWLETVLRPGDIRADLDPQRAFAPALALLGKDRGDVQTVALHHQSPARAIVRSAAGDPGHSPRHDDPRERGARTRRARERCDRCCPPQPVPRPRRPRAVTANRPVLAREAPATWRRSGSGAAARVGPSAPTTQRATVEVFAEITCPFADVGLRRFVGRREELGLSRPVLRVRAWPLELVNGKPLEPSVVAQHVVELREQVAPDLFGGFVPDLVPVSSMPALELVTAAYALNDRAGENVSLLVRDALFEQGLDISDPEVLAGIAAVHGVSVHTDDAKRIVLHDYEEGRRRAVRGSPEFFLDGRGWYCPSLHIEKVDDTLRIEPDIETVEAFLAACFE